MNILYFAWIREMVGKGQETVELPDTVTTAAELLDWLAGRGENYARALQQPSLVRIAMDQVHVGPETPIREAREIALFPPMTGG